MKRELNSADSPVRFVDRVFLDPRFFTPVRLRCRGLYKINKPALKAYAESLEAKETR
jgi:hypothetical protein